MMDKIKEYLEWLSSQFGGNKQLVRWVAVALFLILVFSVAVSAQPNQDHTCQGGHNCNEYGGGGTNEQTQGQQQGQLQGQQQGQSQQSNADATAIGVATGVGQGGEGGRAEQSQTSRNELVAGGGSSSSHSAGGDSDASSSSHSSGNSVSVSNGATDVSSTSGGGNASTGDASVTLEDNSVLIYEDSPNAASSVAGVFAGYCQTGVSGQIVEGGFAVVHTEQFCNHVRLADVMYQAAQRELDCEPIELGYLNDEGEEVVEKKGELCMYTSQGEKFMDAYYDNLYDAHSLIEFTEGTSKLDAAAKQLMAPLGLLGALIWLI